MSRILIEATPFEIGSLESDFRHLYLVLVDDQGVETVITAAPDENGPVDFGNIEVSAGGLLEDSDVARGNDTPGSRGSREIDVGDRDPADVWAVMLQQAQNIDQASLDYQPLGDNSNTVISAVLQAVGIDARNNLPNAIDRDEVPGLTNELDFSTTLVGAAGDDIIVGGDRADVLRGQDGDDALRGGPGGDVISGGAGSDRLTGGEGADRLLGGPGLDTLEGDEDADRLSGGPDDDVLSGNLDPDRLHGGHGDDTLLGGAGDDLLDGAAGNDRLTGGAGDDQLDGGPGADQMRGGPGSDGFGYARLADAGDTILDFETGAGADRLELADLLDGFDPATSDPDDFVSLSEQAGDTEVGVNPDGQGADAVALVTLAGVTGASVDTLIADGNLEVAPPTS
jgi:Ca2+-binding RTX toxin-like protein